jgi:molecular chaperone DnaK (HSP70)
MLRSGLRKDRLMTPPKFSIGVDLGTSNSVLAFSPLSGDGGSQVLAISQWDTPSTVMDSVTLPSFLYLPEDAVAAQIRDLGPLSSGWVVGRLARRKTSETPGRVVQSAKSWLCQHAADRTAPFLPWLSDTLAEQDKISPVTALELILAHLRAAWNDRFAGQGPGFAFDAQDIAITVPASFDAAAQRLTLLAAQQAGFPDHVRLLEEPQAAFYAWLEQKAQGVDTSTDSWAGLPDPVVPRHILVIDIGGGTSDFSLFEQGWSEGQVAPDIKRIAVSDHILLGGDNIDLAIAHLAETRLAAGEAGLSAAQWDHLIAQCRSLKERALGDGAAALDGEAAPDETFTVSVPGRGSGLFANTLSATVTRAELVNMILAGFFPDCLSTDRPERISGAVREWGLPYASDSAITRHLAGFLRDRPAVDAVLFNGGSLLAPQLRERLREQIGLWQDGRLPQVLENAGLDLAVARGAAYSGKLLRQGAARIEGGSARAVFVEAHRTAQGDDEADRHTLICILPHGAPAGELIELSGLDLHLRVNTPVRFQVYTSTRHDETRAGDVVALTPDAFHALPPLETVATAPRAVGGDSSIPVVLNARINELGLLQLSCRSLDARMPQSWPLEFNLRLREGGAAPAPAAETQAEPDVPPATLAEAEQRIGGFFTQPLGKREKFTAQRLVESLEQILGRSKGDWNATLLRDLWTSLAASQNVRALSVEHEETWLILAGFLLRPGFGLAMDEIRIEQLWRICDEGLRFPGKRTKLQEYVLWRRVAGGLSQERQEALVAAERIFERKNVPAELIRMVGAFERIGQDRKREIVERFIETVVELASEKKHCAPYLAALGFLLTRTPFYAGPETIAPPALVEQAYEAFRHFDWKEAEFTEVQMLFMRAARAVDDRRLDLPGSLRSRIANKLEKCGIAPAKTDRLRKVEPVQRAERLSFYGEAVPPGLILSRPV